MSDLSPYFIERNNRDGFPAAAASKMAEYSEAAGIGLADCWKIIAARWRLIAILVLLALAVTAVIVFTMTPRYAATATLLIDPEPPHLMDIASLLERMQAHDEDDYAKTQYSLLRSDQLIAQVINELRLEKNPAFVSNPGPLQLLLACISASQGRAKDRLGVSKGAIDNYFSHLSITPDNGTRLVNVTFDSPNRDLAAAIVNTHVRDYLMLNRNLQSQSGEAARTYLQKELIRVKGQVEKAEAALNAYRDRTGILAFGGKDEDKNEVAQQTMEDLEKALTDAQDERIKAESEMQLVRSGDYKSLPEVVNNLLIQNLKPEVDHLQGEYAEMSAKYNDAYPPLGEAKARLIEERMRVNKEMESIALATKRRYLAAVAREKNLERKVAEERGRDFARNDASLQDAVLERQVEANREVYEAMLKRMQEVGVNGAAPVSNIGVVADAIPPPIPAIPQKLKTLAIAGLLSVVLGVALALALEQFDNRFKSADEIRSYLQLPELGILPDFAKLPGRRAQLGMSDGLMLACAAPTVDVRSQDGARRGRVVQMLEAYKGIRTALLYSRAGGAPKTILFTSALTAEGKTVSAAGTALAFAQTGARTLLVDADLRRPQCHRIFGTDNSVGLAEVLVGRAEPAIRHLDNWPDQRCKGLFLLSAGGEVPNPGELLASVAMFKLTRQLADDFDFVVMDSSPALSASDAVGLATMLDGVVVVAAIQTPKQTVRTVCGRLSNAGAKVIGVMINRLDLRSASFSDFARHYGYGQSYAHSRQQSGAGEAAWKSPADLQIASLQGSPAVSDSNQFLHNPGPRKRDLAGSQEL